MHIMYMDFGLEVDTAINSPNSICIYNDNNNNIINIGSRRRGVEVCGCGVVAAETLILLVCYVKFEIPCYLCINCLQ